MRDPLDLPLIGAIYRRAIHVLNQRSRDLWQSDMASLRTAMDQVIENQYAAELEKFSNEFADRLVQEGGWELAYLPEYLRDEDASWHVSHDDAKALLDSWPDPTRQPDGYPDQKISDIEALEEVIFQRTQISNNDHPSEAQSYALIALEKVFSIDGMVAQSSPSELTTASLLFTSKVAIEAMEMICTAERKLVQARLPEATAEQIKKLESEVLKRTKLNMAKSGATTRWKQDPKTAAKQQVKECWAMWQADPTRYASKKEFAFDMLGKYEELTNPETIQRWCRDWQTNAASSVTTLPAQS